jgi:hypothetical protein
MSTQTYTSLSSYSGHRALPSHLKWLLNDLYSCSRYVAHEVAVWRARRELLDLPDAMLADLGISRSEVPSVVRYGRSDPTRLPRGKC